MATLVAPFEAQQRTADAVRRRDQRFGLVLVSSLTFFAFLVHGYHPYAEDGGLYVAGVKHLLNPALYPHATAFVLEPTRFSLFAPLVAAVVRLSHLGLPAVLLALHLISIWLTLTAVWMLASRCWAQRAARAGAVVLLACWLTLPVAGTALFLMDPYLTARSFSTPCTLLALAGVLDLTAVDAEPRRRLRGFMIAALSLAFAAAMHPLMTAYALWAVLMLVIVRSPRMGIRRWGPPALAAATLAFVAALQHRAHPESSAYVRVALTRTYWFPSMWAWYELAGLAAPVLLLVAFALADRRISGRRVAPSALQALTRMSIALGLTASVVALLFAHAASGSHLIARMQPLRAFQIVYLIMVLALGAMLGERLLRRQLWRWCAAAALLAGIMFAAQRSAFPDSNHIELPSQSPQNLWTQAFLWARGNSPTGALFALDADYISALGEDAQSFRAIAERSALPDYSKDGGEASIAPDLTAAWIVGQSAQQGLSAPRTTDAQRLAALRPLGVSWVIVQATAPTGFECPYRNAAVKACRLF